MKSPLMTVRELFNQPKVSPSCQEHLMCSKSHKQFTNIVDQQKRFERIHGSTKLGNNFADKLTKSHVELLLNIRNNFTKMAPTNVAI